MNIKINLKVPFEIQRNPVKKLHTESSSQDTIKAEKESETSSNKLDADSMIEEPQSKVTKGKTRGRKKKGA
jgi:hypothetical protein